jgi:protein-tyrosine-phosphatase/DNA-binding transcriptional ArsR family regulator
VTHAPRAFGRPLDAAGAATRARQIAALTDPLRLRVLSAIAVGSAGPTEPAALADALGSTRPNIEAALDGLAAAGLTILDDGGKIQLSADAWVRFGRLLSGTSADAVATAPAIVTADAVDPVVARLTADLSYRFSATFSPETVARYVAESYALLADRAHITRFLPSLTARFAADRLSALATAQGLVLRGTPEVLFVCVQNAGRSQMAAAILRHLAGPTVHVRTAGSAPASTVHSVVIDALDEIGVPLASEFPKPLTDEVVQAADYVITMGCGDACPIFPGRRYLDWSLADPVGMAPAEVRVVRDEIFDRVRGLLAEMNLTRRRADV